MRHLGVVYDLGTSAVEIFLALESLAKVTFIVPDSEYNEAFLPLLQQLADVVRLGGSPADGVPGLLALGLDGIVTYSEPRLRLTAMLADRLGLPFHSPLTTRCLTDKLLQRQRLNAAGVDGTRSTDLTKAADWARTIEQFGLPLVVKPRCGFSSRDTHVVTDAEAGAELVAQLLALPDQADGFVVEEFLRGAHTAPFGDHVSVESMVSRGIVTTLAVTGKFPVIPPFRLTGQFWPSHLPEAQQRAVSTLAADALNALGVDRGVTHTEIKLTPAGPRVIEVNGRLGGYLNELYSRTGAQSFIEIAGRLALDEDIRYTPVQPDRVYFQYMNQPPLTACSLVEVKNVADVRAMTAVSKYIQLFKPGSPLSGGVMSQPLDLISGAARDHEAMMVAEKQILDTLHFVFGMADGQIERSARALRM